MRCLLLGQVDVKSDRPVSTAWRGKWLEKYGVIVSGLVENGVVCDILTSEMATVIPSEDPANEYFSLTAKQSRTAVGFVGLKKYFDLGVLTTSP